MEEPNLLRTSAGIASFVERQHAELAEKVRSDENELQPSAVVFVTRSPETGERLKGYGVVNVHTRPDAPLDHLIAGVRRMSLEAGGYGVMITLPIVVVEDLPLDGRPLTAEPSDLAVAFVVEHMDEKIGRQAWTATVTHTGPGLRLGELQKTEAGVHMLGSLDSLLPQKQMN